MSWRLAASLEQLRREVWRRWPGTTVWTIGDAAHRARSSDHNPNRDDVVTAADVVGASKAKALWDEIRSSRDPRVKYLIHDRQIVSSTVQPWVVRRYDGSNPHTDHIHVSVGRGPSGQSTHPALYDDEMPWRIAERPEPEPPEEFDIMADPETSKALHRLADAADIRNQTVVAREVAAIRERAGLPADPASDAVWVRRIVLEGGHTLADAAEAIVEKADG